MLDQAAGFPGFMSFRPTEFNRQTTKWQRPLVIVQNNCIALTCLFRHRRTSVDSISEQRRKHVPAQRFGQPDEFGAYCAFICSAHAGFLTGQNLLLDGGSYPGTF